MLNNGLFARRGHDETMLACVFVVKWQVASIMTLAAKESNADNARFEKSLLKKLPKVGLLVLSETQSQLD